MQTEMDGGKSRTVLSMKELVISYPEIVINVKHTLVYKDLVCKKEYKISNTFSC